MPGLELVPLETGEAAEYWKAFVAGRNDLASANFVVHLEHYLGQPPEDQRTYFAFKENGRVVGTVRIGGAKPGEPSNVLSFFSLVPEAREWARDAILAAAEPMIANGASSIVASYDDSYSEVFTKLGFQERFARMRMEVLPSRRDKPAVPMTHPEATDVEDVATFLMAVYDGHMEQPFGLHVGPPAEWRDYMTSIWKGVSGTYTPLASWLTRDDAGLAGASLVSTWMGTPLLAELGVRKDRRGQGLGRALVTATMNALIDLGYDRLSLYVTLGNDPAIHLYEGLGFRQAGGRTLSAVLEL